jgi:hypothetical protein
MACSFPRPCHSADSSYSCCFIGCPTILPPKSPSFSFPSLRTRSHIRRPAACEPHETCQKTVIVYPDYVIYPPFLSPSDPRGCASCSSHPMWVFHRGSCPVSSGHYLPEGTYNPNMASTVLARRPLATRSIGAARIMSSTDGLPLAVHVTGVTRGEAAFPDRTCLQPP